MKSCWQSGFINWDARVDDETFMLNLSSKISLFFFQSHKPVMIISAVFFLLISTSVTCRPSTTRTNKLQSIGFQKADDVPTEDARLEKCNTDMDLNELCQRCEKISESKAGDVFAMCCSNEDKATEFCRDYVFYGVTR
jgi:hypothetical protein